MITCQPLSAVALRLKTNESDLIVLHLQRLHLTEVEIGTVLDTEQPPYSLARIPKILGRPIEKDEN